MIRVKSGGSFSNFLAFADKMSDMTFLKEILNRYGQIGAAQLSDATPVDTAQTAQSWGYEVKIEDDRAVVYWHNSHTENSAPIAILIQYGHATRNGSWVEGRDFINPTMQPIFDQMVDDVWEEVTS